MLFWGLGVLLLPVFISVLNEGISKHYGIFSNIIFPYFSYHSSLNCYKKKLNDIWETYFLNENLTLETCQFSSVAQSCLTLCDPMDCSMPDFPVHHQLPKLAQTYVHRVSDAIQPSHPVLSPSPPALQSFPASGLDTSFSTKNVMLWCFAHVFIFFIRQQLLKLRVSVSVIFIWSML